MCASAPTCGARAVDGSAERGDVPTGLVAENEGVLGLDGAVAEGGVVVQVGAAEGCAGDLDADFVLAGWWEDLFLLLMRQSGSDERTSNDC